jgi:hypothetical protein
MAPYTEPTTGGWQAILEGKAASRALGVRPPWRFGVAVHLPDGRPLVLPVRALAERWVPRSLIGPRLSVSAQWLRANRVPQLAVAGSGRRGALRRECPLPAAQLRWAPGCPLDFAAQGTPSSRSGTRAVLAERKRPFSPRTPGGRRSEIKGEFEGLAKPGPRRRTFAQPTTRRPWRAHVLERRLCRRPGCRSRTTPALPTRQPGNASAKRAACSPNA